MKNKSYKKDEHNKKLNIKYIVLIIIILVLISINIILLIIKVLSPKMQEERVKENYEQLSTSSENTTTETKSAEDIFMDKLKSGTERDRMEYYFAEFLNYIQMGEYEKAYDLLYPEFKESYFKTLDEFKIYADATYPKYNAIEYEDIERQGDIYILMINIKNVLDENAEPKEQRIILRESDYNNFVLSFQVI